MKEKKLYTEAERAKTGRNAGVIGIAFNLVLFAVKVTVGILTSGVSLIADAVNNLSDAGCSVIVMLSYILAGKPADKKHPYGHARMEYLSTLIISIIITMLGFELFKSSVSSIISGGGNESYSKVSVIVMAATVLIKLGIAIYFKVVGGRIGSASLIAASHDSFGDVGATTAVICGMLLSGVTGPATDGVLGCAIALYIFILGIKLIVESSDTLLGAAPDRSTVDTVVKKLEGYDGVLGIHDLIMHSYGEGRFFASVHVEVDAECDVMQSHDMIDNIERDFMSDLGISLVIHLDPVCIGDERVDSLRLTVGDILREISDEVHFPVSMHDFRAVFGVTHTNLIFDVMVSYDFPLTEKELKSKIQSALSGTHENCFCVITVDRNFSEE
ncbi:MAG: cation transporter [Clostridia bacterium]|nr:cation transporter [Clostridia bacterium]